MFYDKHNILYIGNNKTVPHVQYIISIIICDVHVRHTRRREYTDSVGGGVVVGWREGGAGKTIIPLRNVCPRATVKRCSRHYYIVYVIKSLPPNTQPQLLAAIFHGADRWLFPLLLYTGIHEEHARARASHRQWFPAGAAARSEEKDFRARGVVRRAAAEGGEYKTKNPPPFRIF